ncbi:polysaccharide biosynthesis C-terminal domain-containing protein [Natronococcus wangiae]|uniref:polysaccharide biosynthesis C-terminal domain-containing protein n=1 Tax=Natronococcus wangiae TaxID=3068275 RepID=UPI00273DB0C7|nr:polysaccharide biosynthesis C-terminal domain-containing protein [Natronococcus sp. AD5]
MVGNIELIVLPSGFYLHTLIGPNSKLLLAIGETRAMMKASIQSAILNITLNYLLIPQYSIMGAALATAGSYVVLNIIYVYYIWRSIRMSIIQIRPIVIIIFGVLLYTLVNIITGVLQIKNPVLELIICVSLFSLVYAVFSILYSGVYKSINYDIVSNHFYSE